jgi:hypothetical protein
MVTNSELDRFDIIETTVCIEKEIGVNMHLDVVFNENILNTYFNYDLNKNEDILTINFEIDEGSASLCIYNAFGLLDEESNENLEFDYDYNDVLKRHIKNLGRVLN